MSEDNRTIIRREFEKHKGQFVISGFQKVQRLIALGDDDFDYYWIFWDGRKVTWQSCCGGFVPLKGFIEDIHYNEFIRLAQINHCDQPNCWIARGEEKKKEIISLNEKTKREIETLSPPSKYITEVCWEVSNPNLKN